MTKCNKNTLCSYALIKYTKEHEYLRVHNIEFLQVDVLEISHRGRRV